MHSEFEEDSKRFPSYEHQLGLAERDLGLAMGYVPEVLEQCHSRGRGLDNINWTRKVW